MSDDDDYYDDGYDDGDGDFFFYDETNELADDLAEHTAHSPVFLDDPAFEMMDGYSDWEYYSDDYYDDDPTIVHRESMDDPNKSPRLRAVKGRKKRKLVGTDNIPELFLGEAIAHDVNAILSSRGVVWKDEESEWQPPLYEPGQGEQVALLKNWREIFKNSQPRNDARSRTGNSLRRGRGGRGTLVDMKSESDADDDEKSPEPTRSKRTKTTRQRSNVSDQRLSVHQNGVLPEQKVALSSVNNSKKQEEFESIDEPDEESEVVPPPQNKKRKAPEQDENTKPNAKRVAPRKVIKEEKPPPRRVTRSRKPKAS